MHDEFYPITQPRSRLLFHFSRLQHIVPRGQRAPWDIIINSSLFLSPFLSASRLRPTLIPLSFTRVIDCASLRRAWPQVQSRKEARRERRLSGRRRRREDIEIATGDSEERERERERESEGGGVRRHKRARCPRCIIETSCTHAYKAEGTPLQFISHSGSTQPSSRMHLQPYGARDDVRGRMAVTGTAEGEGGKQERAER